MFSPYFIKGNRAMQTSVLDAKHFHDENAAFAYLEARLWPNGPVCPHCGGFDRIGKMAGKSTRVGVYKCYQCRKPFRVTGWYRIRGEPRTAAALAAMRAPDGIEQKGH
jgi:transposase-like protein